MQKTAKPGDTLELDGPAGMVRLPDGSVVTCRDSYTFRVEGTHVIYSAAAEEVGKVKVTAPKAEG